LSTQPQYDFGLRCFKRCCKLAGYLKHNRKLSEHEAFALAMNMLCCYRATDDDIKLAQGMIENSFKVNLQ